jgi:hypothetical protein
MHQSGTKRQVDEANEVCQQRDSCYSGHGNQTASDTPPAKPSIIVTVFEKLFGKPAPIRLAYATTDDSGLGAGQVAARYDEWTAVYDISAHTVYMPDGTQLEAHSGLGGWLDDPNHANEKMRGVTPPNIYDLELREELFHRCVRCG